MAKAGAGSPLAYEIAEGPMTVAGTPFVEATVTSLGIDARVLLALAIGTTPADARVVQNNMLPLAEMLPVTEEDRRIELPAVAAGVPEGQRLFLMVSSVSDQSFGHGSRTPGALLLEDVVVRVPLSAS